MPTLRELSKVLGFSPASLSRHKAKGWDGNPDTHAEWVRANIRGKDPSKRDGTRIRTDQAIPDNGADGPAKNWNEEYRRIKVARELLELRKAQGEVVPLADVQAMFVERVTEVRQALLALPRSLGRRLANQTAAVCEEEIDREVRALLERFSRGAPILEGKTTTKGKKRKNR